MGTILYSLLYGYPSEGNPKIVATNLTREECVSAQAGTLWGGEPFPNTRGVMVCIPIPYPKATQGN